AGGEAALHEAGPIEPQAPALLAQRREAAGGGEGGAGAERRLGLEIGGFAGAAGGSGKAARLDAGGDKAGAGGGVLDGRHPEEVGDLRGDGRLVEAQVGGRDAAETARDA